MKRAALLAVSAALACGTNNGSLPATDFLGPSGLAIAPLVDRDLLFIANQGSNDLRAMNLCHTPNPASCQSNQDYQFLPGPIRVLPGSILAGEHPLRLAGLPLVETVGGTTTQNHGAVLVAALSVVDPNDPTKELPALQLFDAANLLAATNKTATAADPGVIKLPDPAVDVVAATTPATTVTAFAVSQTNGSNTGTLTVLTVTVPTPGGLAQATVTQQCALDFLPTRLALVPGSADFVYVADGTLGGTPGGIGDGMVEIATATVPAAPPAGGPIAACPNERRIPASDPLDSPRLARPLESIAVSPAAKAANDAQPSQVSVSAGSFILGVTLGDSSLCANHAVGVCAAFDQPIPPGSVCVDQGIKNCGEGRVVMFNNTPGVSSSLMRAPGAQPQVLPMSPLRPPGAAREVAFMGRTDCTPPTTPPLGSTTIDYRCSSIRTGVPQGAVKILQRSLIGVVTTIDGSTLFIDVDNVRFFDDGRDSTLAAAPIPFLVSATIVPEPPPGVSPPLFTLAPADPPVAQGGNPHKQSPTWLNAGVTRSSQWRVVWHPIIPGLESVAAMNMTQQGPHGLITLTLSKDLTPWINSPELQLGQPSACTLPYPQCVQDFVRILSYSSVPCGDFAVPPTTTDIPIVAVTANTITLEPQPGFYDPALGCFGSVGATFEVHAGDSTAGGWVVLEDLDVLGRLQHGGQLMIVTGTRFDYPLDLVDTNNNPLPQPSPTDNALAFSITGPEPIVGVSGDGTAFTLIYSSGASPTTSRDNTILGNAGYAGPVLVYSSTQRQNDEVVFTAVTGSNSLQLAIPAQFGLSTSFAVLY